MWIRRTTAISDRTAPMNRKWPASTPRLKNSSAVGMCPCGRPASLNPPAKPRPCISPKMSATIHGAWAAILVDAASHVNNLRGDKDDAQGDDRLDRALRHMHEAECRCRERDAVGDRERGHGLDQLPAAPRDDQQRQDKEQMIDASENVFDAEHEVGAYDGQRARCGLHDKRRSRRREPRDCRRAVEPLLTNYHLGRGGAETGDVDRAAGQPARALHRPALGEGVVGHRSSWRGEVRAGRQEVPRTARGGDSLPAPAPSRTGRTFLARSGGVRDTRDELRARSRTRRSTAGTAASRLSCASGPAIAEAARWSRRNVGGVIGRTFHSLPPAARSSTRGGPPRAHRPGWNASLSALADEHQVHSVA